jgi:hypothetical protein
MKRRPYLFSLIFLLLAALACTLPGFPSQEVPPTLDFDVVTVEPEPAQPTDLPATEAPLELPNEAATQEAFACGANMVTTSAFSVEFCYPGGYSSGYSQSLLAANPPDGEMAIWGVHPQMIELTLTGYPVDNQYHQPIIRIYPVDAFVALEPHIQTLVDDLQALLDSGATNPSDIPFVPIFNAAQMMQAAVTHLSFRNGKGVRFITQYGQAAMPISNDSAFYAFIGLTENSAYLISATLPVTHPTFVADNMTEPSEGWAAFSENYQTYIDVKEGELSLQAQDSFFPNLAYLDAMMASFLIPADAIP